MGLQHMKINIYQVISEKHRPCITKPTESYVGL